MYTRTLGGIKECFESIYKNCYTCAPPMVLCTNKCYCNNNYYWNRTTCLACDSSCSICNGPLLSDCLLNNITNNKICKDGYFFHSDTCDNVTYYNCFPCDPSCFSCTGPDSTDCNSCIQNATLQSNNSCLCSEGWSGTPPLCIRNYFTAGLFVISSNQAVIVFSEPLKEQLFNSNLSVFLNKENFSINMINSSSYLVKIVYDESNLQNKSLKLLIIGSIVSQYNSLLLTQNLNTIINPCQYLNFTLSITLTLENSLILSFHEKLLLPLIQKDMKLSISNIKDYSFIVTEYSVSSYLINVTYNENIGNNSELVFKFTNPVYSMCNHSLMTLKYEFDLNPTVLSYEALAIYNSEQTSTTVTQSITVGSVSISILNLNFITLWSFWNTIQLLCYIRLSSIRLPPKFNGQLKGLIKFNMIPNVFEYFLNEKDYKITEPQLLNFGFTTSLIFFNCGRMITIGLALFAFFVVCIIAKLLLFLTPCKSTLLTLKVDSLIQSFRVLGC